MTKFDFVTDSQSQKYCESIVKEMMSLFSIEQEEAVGRMNRLWKGLEFIGEDDLIYHEEESDWAYTIYYGNESKWWTNPPDLKPLPWP